MSSSAANEVRQTIDRLAAAITDRHYARHADVYVRYGAQGRMRCQEDAAFHLQYLAAALDADAPQIFSEYIAWSKVVLIARGVSADDLRDNLQIIAEALTTRLPADALREARAMVEQAIAELPSMPDDIPSFIDAEKPRASLATEYLQHLLDGKFRQAAAAVAKEVDGGASLRDVYCEVLEPAQKEIGRLWQMNRITVAQEHYATNATQQVMTQIYSRGAATNGSRGNIVAMCVGGEQHEVGLRVLTDLLELAGWQTWYLGANVPAAAAADMAVSRKANVVLISATLPPHVASVAATIARIRAEPALRGTKVIVGGRAFNNKHELWKRAGADAYARSAEECVDLLTSA